MSSPISRTDSFHSCVEEFPTFFMAIDSQDNEQLDELLSKISENQLQQALDERKDDITPLLAAAATSSKLFITIVKYAKRARLDMLALFQQKYRGRFSVLATATSFEKKETMQCIINFFSSNSEKAFTLINDREALSIAIRKQNTQIITSLICRANDLGCTQELLKPQDSPEENLPIMEAAKEETYGTFRILYNAMKKRDLLDEKLLSNIKQSTENQDILKFLENPSEELGGSALLSPTSSMTTLTSSAESEPDIPLPPPLSPVCSSSELTVDDFFGYIQTNNEAGVEEFLNSLTLLKLREAFVSKDLNHRTPLILAIEMQNSNIVEMLLKKAREVNYIQQLYRQKDVYGDLPLALAVCRNHKKIVHLLYLYDDLTKQNFFNNLTHFAHSELPYTPISVSIRLDLEDVFNELMEIAGEMEQAEKIFQIQKAPLCLSPIEEAAKSGHTNFLRIVCEKMRALCLLDDKCIESVKSKIKHLGNQTQKNILEIIENAYKQQNSCALL